MNVIAKVAPANTLLQAQSPWRRVIVDFMSSSTAVVGLLLLLVIVLLAAFVPMTAAINAEPMPTHRLMRRP